MVIVLLLIGLMTTRECQPPDFLELMQTMELCTAVLGQIFSFEVRFTIKGMNLYCTNEQIQHIIRFFLPFCSFGSDHQSMPADKVGSVNYALRKYVHSELLLGS